MTAGRIDHLDGLRAIAIGAVLAVHWIDDYTPIGGGGHLGVDLFFVLSGYIITTILWRGARGPRLAGDVGDFLRRRVRRLYPALVGLTLGTLVLWAVVPPEGSFDLDEVVGQAATTLAQLTWLTLSQGDISVYGHTWSLGVEWVFYLLWPWLLLGLRSRGTSPKRVAAITLVLAAVIYAASFAVDELWYTYGPTGRVAVMLAGAALALVMLEPQDDEAPRARRLPDGVLDAIAVVLLAAFAAYVCLGYRTFDPNVRWAGVPLATVVGVYLVWHGYARREAAVWSLLTLPWMTLLGRVSYSLYLWHFTPLIFLDKDNVDLPAPLLGLLGLVVTAVLTALSYRYLEKPFLRSRGAALAARPETQPSPR